MTLGPGSRLGPYEITAKLGEGGMGEVYRATDTKLERQVAIKVLPAAFTDDKSRLDRFEREAKLLAQLHHPHIASIFGLEESSGVSALVMELVEGPTLSERLSGGPLPLDEALPIARQIAEALEEAHEKGIIHRDLKPQNVKLTSDGRVKVLDFGLAKAMDPGGIGTGSPMASPTLMSSPTLTAMPGTQLGVILGTAAYMAPEQARGQAVDKRADIWAFGVVLYEMLSGAQLFAAETVSDTLAAVIRKDVDFERLPPSTPRAVARLLERCLDRDPRNRLRDIGEARVLLADPEARIAGSAPDPPTSGRAHRLAWWAFAGALTLALLFAGLWSRARGPEAAPPALVRARIASPEGAPLVETALSPDGRKLAMVTLVDGQRSLWVRALDGEAPQRVAGTEGATLPFWSPDGDEVAFFAQHKLRAVALAGGNVRTLADVSDARGGSWSSQGTLLFAPGFAEPIHAVPAAGGPTQPVTDLDLSRHEDSHRHPLFLPDGRHFVYLLQSSEAGVGGLYLGELGTDRKQRILASNYAPVYAGANYLVFFDDETLRAAPFDPVRGALTAPPFPIVEGVAHDDREYVAASAAGDSLALIRGGFFGGVLLTAFDRAGRSLGSPLDSPVWAVSMSPDESRLAVYIEDQLTRHGDIWQLDLGQGTSSRLTFDPSDEVPGPWSPDGTKLAFSSDQRAGFYDLYVLHLAGGDRELLLSSDEHEFATDWSPDGRYLLYSHGDRYVGSATLAALDLETGETQTLAGGAGRNYWGKFSPDGKWIAFQSQGSGRTEVYVRSFPGSEVLLQVSTEGGSLPFWTRGGRELTYRGPEHSVLAVEVGHSAGGLTFSRPELLFRRSLPIEAWAVQSDGETFYQAVETSTAATAVDLILGWRALLAGRGQG